MLSRTNRRMSVAICSLRLRPVCSLSASVPIFFCQLQLDEMMDVLSLAWGGVAHAWAAPYLLGWRFLVCFSYLTAWLPGDAVGPVELGLVSPTRVRPCSVDFEFFRREDSGGCDGLRVGLAGSYLLWKQPPVERKRSLPLLESTVEWLTKAAGPHLCGFIGHWVKIPQGR